MALTRRRLLKITTASAAVLALPLSSRKLQATPECEGLNPTRRQTAGPFYSKGPPERASFIEPGVGGKRMILKGRVLNTDCQTVGEAHLDFWHASPEGGYDNDGFQFRGWQTADSTGAYELETLAPGHYPGRTSHIHVKANAPDGKVLTTQVYFPWDERNAKDGIFRESLLVEVEEETAGLVVCRFDFVLTT